jgi:hypothetical protein
MASTMTRTAASVPLEAGGIAFAPSRHEATAGAMADVPARPIGRLAARGKNPGDFRDLVDGAVTAGTAESAGPGLPGFPAPLLTAATEQAPAPLPPTGGVMGGHPAPNPCRRPA